jgi:hypothetical protein
MVGWLGAGLALAGFIAALVGGYYLLSLAAKQSPSLKALLKIAETMKNHNHRKYGSS